MNYTSSFVLKNLQNTEEIAQKISSCLYKGDVLALSGDLGTGKTTFCQFILKFFDFTEVSSPTFNLMHEYRHLYSPFYHFDLYRLENEEEIFNIGIEEAFYKGISLIEWAERFKNYLPKRTLWCEIHKEPDSQIRTFTFKIPPEWAERFLLISKK